MASKFYRFVPGRGHTEIATHRGFNVIIGHSGSLVYLLDNGESFYYSTYDVLTGAFTTLTAQAQYGDAVLCVVDGVAFLCDFEHQFVAQPIIHEEAERRVLQSPPAGLALWLCPMALYNNCLFFCGQLPWQRSA